MDKITREDIELLARYVELLKEARDLQEFAPNEDQIRETAEYVSNLKEAAELTA